MEVPSQASDAPESDIQQQSPYRGAAVPKALGIAAQCYCALTGVVLPCICILAVMNAEPSGNARWQSGAPIDKAAQLLGGKPTFAYYPLTAYSMISLGLMFGNERRFLQHRWLHMGTYGAVPFACCFGVLLNAVLWSPRLPALVFSSVVCFALCTLLPYAYFRLIQIIASAPGDNMFVVLGWFAVAVATLLFPLTIVFAFACAPWFAASAYLIASHQLFRMSETRRFSLRALMYLVTWLSAFAATWRAAWQMALTAYSQLPTGPPPSDCFVVGAASRGHPWLVGSWKTTSERTINRQLLRFKAFELMLAAVTPSVHRPLRRIYNQIGPHIARRICSPFVADVIFILLKPMEMLTAIAECALRVHAKRADETTPSDSR